MSSRALATLVASASVPFSATAQSTSATAQAAEAAPAAAAQQVTITARSIGGYEAPDTESATKLTLSPRETPQSMTIVTRDRLDDQALTSLRQVLDNTPGVYSSAYDTERVLFYARGFLVDTLMVDGVPALANFNTGSIDETLDTSLYERIEVVRGATGLMTGAGNPAASINLVRKHADSRSLAASFDLTAGSWNDRRAVLDVSTPLSADGRIRARAVAVAEERDSYQALYHKGTRVAYGIVDADLTPSTRLSVGFDWQDNQPRSNTWGSFPLFLADGTRANWPRSVTTATDWSYWNRKTQTAFAELRQEFDNGWKLSGNLSRRSYREDLELFYVYGYPDPVTGEGLQPFVYSSRGHIAETALDLHATGPFELFGRRHELVVGYDGSRATNKGTERAAVGELPPVGNFFQWDGSYPHPTFGEPTPLADIATNQDAAYVAARFSLADPLKLIAGARHARWKTDSFYVYDTPNDSAYDFSKTIPYAGLVWDFQPQFSAFASYTGIFKPQNSRDVDGHTLDPVAGRSVEVGIKGEHLDRRLDTALTFFETRQDNVAAPALAADGSPILLPDGSPASKAIAGTRTRGFELEASGRITSELQGSLGWTHNRTKDGTGQTIRNFIPATLVRVFGTWTPRRLVRGLTVGAGLNWQSSSSTTVGSPATDANPAGGTVLRQPGLALLDLMARYAITPQVSLQVNANNLTDRKYLVLDQYDNSYYGSPANYSVSLRLAY